MRLPVIAAVLLAAGMASPRPLPAGQAPAPPFPRLPALAPPADPRDFDTISQSIRVVPLVTGLAAPWSIAFLPNGDMLVTEKAGRLRIIRSGKLDPQPIAGMPAVLAMEQGALLDLALHPRFRENGLTYFAYSKGGPKGHTTSVEGSPSAAMAPSS